MAVVVRTYATRFRGQHSAEGFDFCDTTHCQVPSWNSASSRISAARDFTRGEICCSRVPPCPLFTIRIVEVLRLPVVKCGLPSLNPTSAPTPILIASPRHRSNGNPAFPSPISMLLFAPLGSQRPQVGAPSKSSPARKAAALNACASEAAPFSDTLISASSFRYAVNRALGWNKIRSDLYNLRNDGDHILFSGRGSGHGVGLCQVGAEEMARQGKDYRQILDFYFPGTHLSKTSVDDWQKRTSERFELVSTSPEEDSALLPVAERILKEDEMPPGGAYRFVPVCKSSRRSTAIATLPANPAGSPPRLAAKRFACNRWPISANAPSWSPRCGTNSFHLLIEPRARPTTPSGFAKDWCSTSPSQTSGTLHRQLSRTNR